MGILDFLMLSWIAVGAVKYWQYSLVALAATIAVCYVFGPVALVPAVGASLFVGFLGCVAADVEWRAKGLGEPDDPGTEDEAEASGADRQGGQHRCRDWVAIAGRISLADILFGTLIAVLTGNWRIGLWASVVALSVVAACFIAAAVWYASAFVLVMLVMLVAKFLGKDASTGLEGAVRESTRTQHQSPADR